jgi:hypothetical protein
MTFLRQCLLELRACEQSLDLRDESLLKTGDTSAAPGTFRHAGPPILASIPLGDGTTAVVTVFLGAPRGPICRSIRPRLSKDCPRQTGVEHEV